MSKDKNALTTEDIEYIKKTISDVLDDSKINDLNKKLGNFLESRALLFIKEQEEIIKYLQSRTVYKTYIMIDNIANLLEIEASKEDFVKVMEHRDIEEKINHFKEQPAYGNIMAMIKKFDNVPRNELANSLHSILEPYVNTCNAISCLKPEENKKLLNYRIDTARSLLNTVEVNASWMSEDLIEARDRVSIDSLKPSEKIQDCFKYINLAKNSINISCNEFKLSVEEEGKLKQLTDKADELEKQVKEIQVKIKEIQEQDFANNQTVMQRRIAAVVQRSKENEKNEKYKGNDLGIGQCFI